MAEVRTGGIGEIWWTEDSKSYFCVWNEMQKQRTVSSESNIKTEQAYKPSTTTKGERWRIEKGTREDRQDNQNILSTLRKM